MSGMDRLTDEVRASDETLQSWAALPQSCLFSSIARELLAHRRASQAAPAPVAWFWERGDDLELTLLKDGRYGKRLTEVGFTAHPLYRAPAPSDGLREAVDAAWNDAIEAAAETIPPTVVYIGGGVVASVYLRRDIRALRRAAPTEGEA